MCTIGAIFLNFARTFQASLIFEILERVKINTNPVDSFWNGFLVMSEMFESSPHNINILKILQIFKKLLCKYSQPTTF